MAKVIKSYLRRLLQYEDLKKFGVLIFFQFQNLYHAP